MTDCIYCINAIVVLFSKPYAVHNHIGMADGRLSNSGIIVAKNGCMYVHAGY